MSPSNFPVVPRRGRDDEGKAAGRGRPRGGQRGRANLAGSPHDARGVRPSRAAPAGAGTGCPSADAWIRNAEPVGPNANGGGPDAGPGGSDAEAAGADAEAAGANAGPAGPHGKDRGPDAGHAGPNTTG